MTDISVSSTNYGNDRGSWNLSPAGTGPGENPGVTFDVSAFTAATHYPDGYLKSGIVVGRITATDLYGPYVDAATDGTGTAAGFILKPVKVDPTNTAKDIGGALLVRGYVDPPKLPVAAGATGGGFLDANARTDLKHVHFAD